MPQIGTRQWFGLDCVAVAEKTAATIEGSGRTSREGGPKLGHMIYSLKANGELDIRKTHEMYNFQQKLFAYSIDTHYWREENIRSQH